MTRLKTIDFHFFTRMAMISIVVLFSLLWVTGCSDDDDGGSAGPSAPTITGINPEIGPVGTEVTITGTNFSTTASENKVSFNDVAATVNSAKATEIKAVVPADATTGPVKVTVGGKTVTGPEFTVEEGNGGELVISAIEPNSGTVNDVITITGAGFSATAEDNTVTFADGKVAAVTTATETSLQVSVPAEAISGPITVTVGEETTTSGIFTVTTANGLGITSIDPQQGEPGDTINIRGLGFSATATDNTVTFSGEADSLPAEIISASDTSLMVKVPEGTITGPVSLTVASETVTIAFTLSTDGGGEGTYMVTTFAGTNENGFNDEVSANEAAFNQPFDLAVDSEGNVYVGDTRNHRVRKITSDGSLVNTFAGGGCDNPAEGCYKDGSGTTAGFFQPSGLAFDPEGNLYVTDNQNHRLRRIAPDGTVTTIAGNGSKGVKDGSGAAAQLSSPYGVYVNADGEIFTSDFGGHTIRKVTAAGEVTIYAGQAGTKGQDDGEKLSATFDSPVPITGDGSGNLYVGDFESGLIRKISSDGQVTTLAGTNDEFGKPAGLAYKDGILYVADREKNTVFKVTESGEVSVVAGSGEAGGKNGEGAAASFDGPNSLAFDKDGNLLVSEHGSSGRIRKITIQ